MKTVCNVIKKIIRNQIFDHVYLKKICKTKKFSVATTVFYEWFMFLLFLFSLDEIKSNKLIWKIKFRKVERIQTKTFRDAVTWK